MPDRPKFCSIYLCPGAAMVPLRAKPPFDPSHPDGVFWFCTPHAAEYEALGYKPLTEGAAR